MNGPGRPEIVVTGGCDRRSHADMLADSAGHGGGTGCAATTANYAEGVQRRWRARSLNGFHRFRACRPRWSQRGSSAGR
jgi:hypothetical protein